jgi:CubicO group peptidase (beta-lactamase class C family)
LHPPEATDPDSKRKAVNRSFECTQNSPKCRWDQLKHGSGRVIGFPRSDRTLPSRYSVAIAAPVFLQGLPREQSNGAKRSVSASCSVIRGETGGYSRWFKTIRSVTIDEVHQVIKSGPNTKGGCSSALDKSKADNTTIMTNNLIYAGFLLMGVLCNGASATPGDTILMIDRFVSAEMSRQKIPGMAVAVVKNGEVVVAKGYGFASLEHQVPVTTHSIFQSGSVGKQFTAAAIMLLEEQGKLRLDDKIASYLPRTKARWGSITLRHVLTHTSGIPEYEDEVDDRRNYSERQLTELVGLLSRRSPPGHKFEYSNSGYLLLGNIIRTVTGKFHGDFIREHIFEPLGMKTARIATDADIVPNRVAGYRMSNGRILTQEWVSPTFNQTADGCFLLSLDDFLTWERGVRTRALLKPEGWSQIFTPVVLKSGKSHPYGFAWEITQRDGQTVHGHDGSLRGFEAILTRYIEEELTIIALANLAEVDLVRITEHIAKLMRQER